MEIRASFFGHARAIVASASAFAALALSAQTVLADPIPAGALPPGVTIQDLGGGNWLIIGPDGSIVDFLSFDIGSGEHVTFQLGSSTARFLNRIIGDFDGTQINGRLSADGIVYFVNPAGVFFGQGAVVDVGGIYAAAATISDSDFLAGNDHFTDVSGVVENAGTIMADHSVHLIAERVANHGAIVAGEAVTMLAAEDEVIITPLGGGRVSVRLDGVDLTASLSRPGSAVDLTGMPGVENTGSITAGTSLILGASDMYGLAIRNTGALEGDDVQLTALGGTVAHEGEITAGSLAMTGGALYLASDIRADEAVFNDEVYIGADLTIRGTSGLAQSLKFRSSIDDYSGAGAGGNHELTLRAQSVDVDGSIGAQDRLGHLDVFGDATFGGDVLTEDGIRFRADVTLNAMNINQRIDAGSGVLDADADIVKSTAGHLTLAGGTLRVGGDIRQTDTLLGGDIRILNDLTLDGANVNQRIDAARGKIDAAGDIVKTTAGHLTLAAADGIELAGDLLKTDTLLGGDLRILSDLRLDAVNINQRIDAGRGTLDVEGDITKSTAGHLTLGGDGGIELAGDVMHTATLLGGNLRLEDDVTLDGSGDQRLSTELGRIDAAGDIEKTTSGRLALVADGGVEIAGNLLHSGGSVDGGGSAAIQVVGDLTLDGSGAQRIDAGTGWVELHGGAVKTTSGTLTIAGDAGIVAEGVVRAGAGNLNLQDAVRLSGDLEIGASGRVVIASSIDGNHELVLDSGGNLFLRGAVGGDTALDSIDIRVAEGSVLHLDGGLLRANGDILLNEAVNLSIIPAVATIAADGDLAIESLSGDVRMGALQKLTVLGTLEIDGAQAVVLGDVNTLEDMIVTASSISLLTRGAGEVRLADGSVVLDGGLDLFAGGAFRFSVAPDLVGHGDVVFVGDDATGALDGFVVETLRSALDLVSGGVVLDAAFVPATSPTPESEANLAEAFSDEAEPERTRVEIRGARSRALLRELAQRFGIVVRDQRPAELAAGTTSRTVLDDSAQTTLEPGASAHRIAYDRLENASVAAAVHAHEAIVGTEGSNAGVVRERISAGWTAYRTTFAVPDPDPEQFIAWLRDHERSATADDLENLGVALDALQSIGVTAGELEQAEEHLLADVASLTVPPDLLRAIVG